MDREIEGVPTADYLWSVKRVVPFLKSTTVLPRKKTGCAPDETNAQAWSAAQKGPGPGAFSGPRCAR
jgi:fructose-bisphosphate aldolase class I